MKMSAHATFMLTNCHTRREREINPSTMTKLHMPFHQGVDFYNRQDVKSQKGIEARNDLSCKAILGSHIKHSPSCLKKISSPRYMIHINLNLSFIRQCYKQEFSCFRSCSAAYEEFYSKLTMVSYSKSNASNLCLWIRKSPKLDMHAY